MDTDPPATHPRAALDPAAAYLALAARDARFDGRLFVGVTSTGIYCRPICRVRTPQQRNCRFFETPAQAEAAAFRPCMKCRPEIAPGAGLPWSVMDASATLARQAAAALDAQAASGEPPRLPQLAARLGISDRHLRRIFAATHGVTPLQYLQTHRLLLAKQLLTDTPLPVAQVALASGFNSLRRFNAAFVASYRMSPSRLRGARAAPAASADSAAPGLAGALCIKLAYRLPCDADGLLRFLAQRAVAGVEEVGARTVRRSVRAGSIAPAAGWIEAEFAPAGALPQLLLRVSPSLAPDSGRVLAAVRRWLDLDAAPDTIDTALAGLPGAAGTRLPGHMDAFELAVRAVLGQQVSVAAARRLAGRLVERFGTPVVTPWPSVCRVFPSPEVLAATAPSRIAELGVIGARAAALVGLAQAWPTIAALLLPPARPEPLIERLCQLPGIGPWTAHYIAMRALGWPDAFLPNDVALRKAMRLRFGCRNQREAEAVASAWQPWRAYAVLRLWTTLAAPGNDAAPATSTSISTRHLPARSTA